MNPLATIYRSRSGSPKNAPGDSQKSDSRLEPPPPLSSEITPPASVAADEPKGEPVDNNWKRNFIEKLSHVQSRWARRFEEALDQHVTPVFEELAPFLRENGFTVSTPLRDEGRRSFKFELIENAYLLLIFRSTSVGAFELRHECFVPGSEPNLTKAVGRIGEIDSNWARQRFQSSLNTLVELLGAQRQSASVSLPSEELVGV